MKPSFVVRLPEGDEGVHIFLVNGVEVGCCDHDSAGWQGMADQRSMFEAIANAFNVDVHVVDGDHE